MGIDARRQRRKTWDLLNIFYFPFFKKLWRQTKEPDFIHDVMKEEWK